MLHVTAGRWKTILPVTPVGGTMCCMSQQVDGRLYSQSYLSVEECVACHSRSMEDYTPSHTCRWKNVLHVTAGRWKTILPVIPVDARMCSMSQQLDGRLYSQSYFS